MAAKPAKELLKQHMPPVNPQDQGESTPNHDALLALLLEHRFPSAWAQSLRWDRAGIAKMLPREDAPDLFGYDPREKRILFNSRIANGLKQDSQGWIAFRSTSEHERAAQLLNDLADLDRPFLADMRDNRAGKGLVLPNGRAVPVFQFNRRRGSVGGILWPLGGHYQTVGSPTYFGTAFRDELPFDAKRDDVFWRGGATGHDAQGRHGVRSLRDHAAGTLSHSACAERLKTIPRFALLDRFQNAPGFDLGFVQPPGQPSVAAFGYKLCRKMTRADMTRSRYQLAIGGNDYASNLPWLLHSNCLVLSQELDCLVCFCGALTAWEHYVPLANDLSDLPEKLAWARAHPDRCKTIVAQANAIAERLASKSLEHRVRSAVLHRYRQVVQPNL